MQSALIIHSRHTLEYAKIISNDYKDVDFLEVQQCNEFILDISNDKDVVIGIGGGAVIDSAKILSGNKQCIAIPTTASGACMTSHAVVWGKTKMSVKTKIPILDFRTDMDLKLSQLAIDATFLDVLCQSLESLWSVKATKKSKEYAIKSIALIDEYITNSNIYTLIEAGNYSGMAIEINGTNIIHAMSYPITIHYGIEHGIACGIVLMYLLDCVDLSDNIISRLYDIDIPPIEDFSVQYIIKEAKKYEKFNEYLNEYIYDNISNNN